MKPYLVLEQRTINLTLKIDGLIISVMFAKAGAFIDKMILPEFLGP